MSWLDRTSYYKMKSMIMAWAARFWIGLIQYYELVGCELNRSYTESALSLMGCLVGDHGG